MTTLLTTAVPMATTVQNGSPAESSWVQVHGSTARMAGTATSIIAMTRIMATMAHIPIVASIASFTATTTVMNFTAMNRVAAIRTTAAITAVGMAVTMVDTVVTTATVIRSFGTSTQAKQQWALRKEGPF